MNQPIVYRPEEGIWLSFHGTPSRIIATGEQTEEALTVSTGVVNPGGGAPPHAHTFDEGFWVLRGEMEFTAGNRKVNLPQGGFIQIRGGTGHFPANRSEAVSEVVTICAPAGFDAFQLEIGKRVETGDGPFPESGAEDNERVKTAGPRHGIDLDPAETLFQTDPEITVRQPGEGTVIATVGDVYRFLVTGDDTGGRYALWHATIYPGGGPPPHIHTREAEFFYVLSGEVTIYDDGQAVKASPGSAVVLPKGTRHWFKNESDTPAEMLIAVAPAGLEKMFKQTGQAWSTDMGAPGKPDEAEIGRLKQIAPGFGIELG